MSCVKDFRSLCPSGFAAFNISGLGEPVLSCLVNYSCRKVAIPGGLGEGGIAMVTTFHHYQ